MMILRKVRRRMPSVLIICFILLSLWYIVLPPDSAVRLAVNFNLSRVLNGLRGATIDRDAWLSQPARYPLDLRRDVGYLIKTGYGTRHRIPAQLEAFTQTGAILGEEGQSFIVVGDWTTVNKADATALGVPIYDAIKPVLETKVGTALKSHQRFAKYQSLQNAIQAGDEDKALQLGKSFGWELDALKFIMGMELLYKQMPNKKWYIILDDDSFLVSSSFDQFLSHLDATGPRYVGNAVGDYKGRFAHGGSGVLLSGETMRQLFNHPSIVAQAYVDSLEETWGDRLVATTLQKLGIYLDERFSHHFNGEPPEETRIASDRFCSPLVSFHRLRNQGDMENVGRKLAGITKPLRWGQVWDIFGARSLDSFAVNAIEQDQDHVGPLDDKTRTWQFVKSAVACRKKCEGLGDSCLAWTHDAGKMECYSSPWMVPGKSGKNMAASGVNWPKIKPLLRQCSA